MKALLIVGSLIDFECPLCGFGMEVELADIICQVTRRCPCCRSRIHLIDDGGNVSRIPEMIDRALGDLKDALGGMTL